MFAIVTRYLTDVKVVVTEIKLSLLRSLMLYKSNYCSSCCKRYQQTKIGPVLVLLKVHRPIIVAYLGIHWDYFHGLLSCLIHFNQCFSTIQFFWPFSAISWELLTVFSLWLSSSSWEWECLSVMRGCIFQHPLIYILFFLLPITSVCVFYRRLLV